MASSAPCALRLSMKAGSMDDMPPSTRVTLLFSAAMAWAGSCVSRAKRCQPGSTSGSQWDLLLGSFQIIAASIMAPLLGLDAGLGTEHDDAGSPAAHGPHRWRSPPC